MIIQIGTTYVTNVALHTTWHSKFPAVLILTFVIVFYFLFQNCNHFLDGQSFIKNIFAFRLTSRVYLISQINKFYIVCRYAFLFYKETFYKVSDQWKKNGKIKGSSVFKVRLWLRH